MANNTTKPNENPLRTILPDQDMLDRKSWLMFAIISEFPAPKQHNLCSTATENERVEFIADVLDWYNQQLLPLSEQLLKNEVKNEN